MVWCFKIIISAQKCQLILPLMQPCEIIDICGGLRSLFQLKSVSLFCH
jgi:hypothetical protein